MTEAVAIGTELFSFDDRVYFFDRSSQAWDEVCGLITSSPIEHLNEVFRFKIENEDDTRTASFGVFVLVVSTSSCCR